MNQPDFGIKSLPELLSGVDHRIKDLAPKNIDGLDRLLQTSGKRLRPRLVIAVAYHSGKKIDKKVIDAAAAIELVHLASLIHDDIMDKAHLRWGVPTIHKKEGVDSAILAGDYLLAKGCALASGVSAEAGKLLAETIADLCEGQAQELASRFDTERSIESLLYAVKGKTSSMFIAACVLGGLVAELNSRDIKALSAFAENFGIYFQYMDDVSDFAVSAEKTGKSMGNDMHEGNYTLPVILSLHGPHKRELKQILKSKEPAAARVVEILKKDKSLERALEAAEEYKQKAILELERLRSAELAEALKSFACQY